MTTKKRTVHRLRLDNIYNYFYEFQQIMLMDWYQYSHTELKITSRFDKDSDL